MPTTAPAPPRERGGRIGLGIPVLGYVVAFVTSNIAVGLYAGASGADLTHLTLGTAISGLIGLWVGLLGTVAYVARRRDVDLGLRFRWIDAPLGAVLGLVCQLGLVELVYLPIRNNAELHDKITKPAKELTDLAHGPGFVVLGLLITVGTPIVEELFFRGVVQTALAERFRPWAAIVLSALAFGLAHQQLLQLPGLFAFGLVLGVLYHRTGRLGLGIVTHAVFNLTTVIALANAR